MPRSEGHDQRSWIYATGRHRDPQGASGRKRQTQPVRFALPVIGAVAWGIDRIFFHHDFVGGHTFHIGDLVSLLIAVAGVGLGIAMATLVLRRAQRRHDARLQPVA
jgi:hypothetical protein